MADSNLTSDQELLDRIGIWPYDTCECETWGGFLQHFFDPCGIHNYPCTYV